MTDIASITRQAHDTGFEQGSIAACNAILAYLNRSGLSVVAQQVLTAWEAGEIGEGQAEVTPVAMAAEPAPTMPPPPRMSREQAQGSGYTGDTCTYCQSLQVKRNGSCLVCEACGNTTGCS